MIARILQGSLVLAVVAWLLGGVSTFMLAVFAIVVGCVVTATKRPKSREETIEEERQARLNK